MHSDYNRMWHYIAEQVKDNPLLIYRYDVAIAARDVGVSRKTILKWVRMLENLGVIKPVRQLDTRHPTAYHVNPGYLALHQSRST